MFLNEKRLRILDRVLPVLLVILLAIAAWLVAEAPAGMFLGNDE